MPNLLLVQKHFASLQKGHIYLKNSNNFLLRNQVVAKEEIITLFICDTHATGCTHPQLTYKLLLL
jgi:hypothetical protein